MRLFVAIELDDGVRALLGTVGARLGHACEGVRWIPTGQLHLTVKFLGEVSDKDVMQTAEAMARGASGAAPFSMGIGGCGCFPPRGGVRIVWAGAHDESGTLLHTVKVIQEELEHVGFERERRPFSSHITIGRVRSDRSDGRIRAAVEACSFEPTTQSVGAVTLMSSVLSPKGPTYTPVRKVDLGQETR